jgi:hypothetical protein
MSSSTTITNASQTSDNRSILYLVAGVVLIWFAISLNAAVSGFFKPAPGEPPLGFLVAIAIPVGIYLLTFMLSATFRSFIRSLNPMTLTLLQSWRVLGSVFMVLYLYDMLPGLFAYLAGLGDVAIGLTAPFIALKLVNNPAFAQSRRFVIWNALGLFDFVVAVGSGTLTSGAFGTALLGDGPTSSLMSTLPLSMIPGFIVPLYILLHLSALISARAKAY